MVKVITYGTFDLLHYGHIRLLERAKKLGDYLIVGVTADDFDKKRGKINVQQSLMERVEAVRATNLADEIIVEEYEGQKIDDVQRLNVDIFTIGSDWLGKFDYLNKYCKVVYLDRTEGISSSELRQEKSKVRLGLVGDAKFLNKVYAESKFVNGLDVCALYSNSLEMIDSELKSFACSTFNELLNKVDAVYIRSLPKDHFSQIKHALENGKHVLCESPITTSKEETSLLFKIAKDKQLVLMDAIKTAYSTAFNRLCLLIKTGKIGEIVSVDVTCTSLEKNKTNWPGFYEWAPTALLSVFEILGTDFTKTIIKKIDINGNDTFTNINFRFKSAVADLKVGDGIKSEGELIISGTKGYVYVPAPWWKTDYFEIRFENLSDNKRFFYQLDGEGIRNELLSFIRSIESKSYISIISEITSLGISSIMQDYENNVDCYKI